MNFGKNFSQELVEYSQQFIVEENAQPDNISTPVQLPPTVFDIQTPETPMQFTDEDVSCKEIYDRMHPNKR